MKKTVSMLLAIIVAAVAICTLATSAFAQVDTGAIPDDPRLEETTVATTVPTTKATTVPTTVAPTTAAPTTAAPTTVAPTTAAPTTEPTTLQDNVVTLAPGQTAYEGQDTEGTTATTKPATTKKPAANVSTIPSTGSSTMAPVIALFALASVGAVAVVKTKKEN